MMQVTLDMMRAGRNKMYDEWDSLRETCDAGYPFPDACIRRIFEAMWSESQGAAVKPTDAIDATGWAESAFDPPDHYWMFKPEGGRPSRREVQRDWLEVGA